MNDTIFLGHRTSPQRDSTEGKACVEVSCALLLWYVQYFTQAASWRWYTCTFMGSIPRRASAYLCGVHHLPGGEVGVPMDCDELSLEYTAHGRLPLPLQALVSHPRGRRARQRACSPGACLGGPRCLLFNFLLAERLLQALSLLLVVLVEAMLLLQELLVLRHHTPQPLFVFAAAA